MYLRLESILPEENRFRLYTLEITRGLFGDICLRSAWGRLGARKFRSRETWYDTDERARKEAARRVRVRIRHRYQLVNGAADTGRPEQGVA